MITYENVSRHLAANEVNINVMAHYKPWADSAILVPLITNIHDLDFLGYIYMEISPQIQISRFFLETETLCL